MEPGQGFLSRRHFGGSVRVRERGGEAVAGRANRKTGQEVKIFLNGQGGHLSFFSEATRKERPDGYCPRGCPSAK